MTNNKQFTAELTEEAEEHLKTTQKAPTRYIKQARNNIERYLNQQESNI
jgi:hypothetical protein